MSVLISLVIKVCEKSMTFLRFLSVKVTKQFGDYNVFNRLGDKIGKILSQNYTVSKNLNDKISKVLN